MPSASKACSALKMRYPITVGGGSDLGSRGVGIREAGRETGPSIADRRPVAPPVGAAHPEAACRIDGDAVGVARDLVPVAPAVDQVAAPLELVDRARREAGLEVQRVARLQEAEAA